MADGPDYGPLLNLLIWTLAVSCTAFLALRIWAKLRRGIKLWYDDHILIAAWISIILSCILQTVDTTLGFGRSNSDVDPRNLDTTRLISTIAGFLLILAAAWSKTSFAITLLRISHGWARSVVVAILVTSNLAIAVSATMQWVHCWPTRKIWQQDIDGYCLPLDVINGYNMFSAGYSGMMDFALAALPWAMFMFSKGAELEGRALDWEGYRMKRKEMLNISAAMSMAVFAGVASFVKIWAIHQINKVNAGPEHVVVLMVLGTAEGAITIMAVSIPVLRTLEGSKPLKV